MGLDLKIRRVALAAAMGLAFGGQWAAPAVAGDKVITWGKPAEIVGLDPHVSGINASWELFEMVYETLLTTDANQKLQPGIAESWQQTSPTSYTFKLRADDKFSNGRPLVASDVIGSLQRIKNPEMASYWSVQLGNIAKMEELDDHTVKIELEKPYTAFLPALAHITAAILPMKELKAGEFDPTKDVMGSGPYMVTEHKQDESWTFAKNPYYWRKDEPKADKIVAPIIPDDSARIAALRDGRIDFTTFDNADAPQMLAKDNSITVKTQQTTNYYRVDLNALSPNSALHDKRVRQAMNLALDRDVINNLVFAGTTKVDYPVPAAFGKTACHDLPTYTMSREQRLEKAKALLKEAGQTSPSISLIAPTPGPVAGRIAQVMQQSLSEAGFNVKIVQQPMAEYVQKVFTEGDFDAALSWLAGYTDPSMVIAWWNPKFAQWNLKFWQDDPALDKALDEVKSMPDGADRDAKLAQICGMIDDGANLLALDNKVDYLTYRSDKVSVAFDTKGGSSSTYQRIGEFAPLH